MALWKGCSCHLPVQIRFRLAQTLLFFTIRKHLFYTAPLSPLSFVVLWIRDLSATYFQIRSKIIPCAFSWWLGMPSFFSLSPFPCLKCALLQNVFVRNSCKPFRRMFQIQVRLTTTRFFIFIIPGVSTFVFLPSVANTRYEKLAQVEKIRLTFLVPNITVLHNGIQLP